MSEDSYERFKAVMKEALIQRIHEHLVGKSIRKLLTGRPYVGDAGTHYPSPDNPNVTIYVSQLKYRGKDDLKSLYPYAHDEWSRTYSPDIDWTEEQYLANPAGYREQIRQDNEDYIAELYRTKKYLEPYVTRMSIMYNPLFDGPRSFPPGQKNPLESYRMIFLDTSGYDGESNINYVKQK